LLILDSWFRIHMWSVYRVVEMQSDLKMFESRYNKRQLNFFIDYANYDVQLKLPTISAK